MQPQILIIDFGSQLTKLIARRIRESGIFCEIIPFNKIEIRLLKKLNLKGLIFSGGPFSVNDYKAPSIQKSLLELKIPILGICYGLQLICKIFHGEVDSSSSREFGKSKIKIKKKSPLINGIYDKNAEYNVWMSHGDSIVKVPEGFETVAVSSNSSVAIIQNVRKNLFGIQFHPEVVHTKYGDKILEKFVFNICKAKRDWKMNIFKQQIINEIRNTVKNENVICGLSGGVDSTVTAVLINEAIGDKLQCIFVNNGLMRMSETIEIKKLFNQNFKINLNVIDASQGFLSKLKGVINPEKKRKIIGREFIRCFENFTKKNKNFKFLAQGTLYPDIIESISTVGKSKVTIKSHHNVGGLPKNIKFELIEPLKNLFKDEVRKLGKELNIPNIFLERHPFPGPGLGIRILGEITPKRIKILQEADNIFINQLRENNLYNKIWQAFCVLLPVKTVGVMGDNRTYEQVCILRAVTSRDGMTAEAYPFKSDFMNKCANKIINNVRGINRVCYDYTSKPPGTIEYE
ncbi:MAG: glutamine-hydrolyzing GMP synthase [Rickettsiales bacterium]|nr:glutamine-hydrolyzing GMP synthase [Rickettsiales bacterium]|tara:strand:+ start:1393 stop:2943 length:1551 start_codon:yes stop_codon:yes gene_type:complete